MRKRTQKILVLILSLLSGGCVIESPRRDPGERLSPSAHLGHLENSFNGYLVTFFSYFLLSFLIEEKVFVFSM